MKMADNMGRKKRTTKGAGRARTKPPRADASHAREMAAIATHEVYEVLNCVAAGVVKISKEGRIVYANAQARRLFEVPDRDPVGMSLREYEEYTIWPDGSPAKSEDYPPAKCLRSGELQPGTTIGLKLPGDRVTWVTVTAVPMLDPKTGRPESAIVTVVDSTHPKHVEDSLRDSEDRYRRLVEQAPDAIVVHRGGPILLVNDAGVRMYGGRSRDDFIGRNVLEFVHPRDRDRAERRMKETMAGTSTPLAVQRHVRLDGRAIHVEVTATPCVYGGQHCAQVICRDVTRRVRAARALRRAKDELEERVRERTEELSRKNAELEHEQRLMQQTLALQERDRKLVAYEIHDTILQDVIGAVMFVDAVYENQKDAPRDVAQSLEQARSLLRHCIEGARRMISGLRPLIIDERGIEGGIEYLAGEFKGRGLDVRFTHAMKPRRLAADLEDAVFRIVQEALTNVERHSHCHAAKVRVAERDGRLHVEISDRGVGFDPRAVADGHYGLEGVKERARLAGGSATITSAPGNGTKVLVVLPVAVLGSRESRRK
jgi:PAS domain S-box-containing protein